LFLTIFITFTTAALTEQEYRASFEDFKITYTKSYTPPEAIHRYKIFKSNLDFITSWDSKSTGFSVGINQFADLTTEEFNRIYLPPMKRIHNRKPPLLPTESTIDSRVQGDIVNWVTKGAVTPIKNQVNCGAGWAFSATGAMEGSKFIRTGVLTSLSEQNLIDCSTGEGNKGCNGGLMDDAFQYVIDYGGIQTEITYPYNATGPNNCRFNPLLSGEVIIDYVDIDGGENALQTVVNNQPVSVAIDGSNSSFQLYKSGIYYEPNCSSYFVNHAVLVVGYGTDSTGNNYWLVKNSFGTTWGMSGYIQMSKNRNDNCGIASEASYPVQ